jgi:hypothetical protein
MISPGAQRARLFQFERDTFAFANELVNEIKARPPAVQTRERVDPLSEQRATLREHYARKSARLGRARLRGEFLR